MLERRRLTKPLPWVAALGLALGATPAVPAGNPAPTMDRGVSPGSIHLAWHRCAGSPGAERNLQFAGGGRDLTDTLVVTWDPGGSVWDDYVAGYAALYFYDAAGDSLAPFWRFGARGQNKRGLLVNLDAPADTGECSSVWRAPTDGGTQYDDFGQFGKLRFTFAVAASQAYPLEGGRRYHVANILLRHDQADSLRGADRPMIVELAWYQGYFGISYHKEYAQGPDRFVTINDPDGENLRRFLADYRLRRVKPWEMPPRRKGRAPP
jgi:hypothetical protein